MFIAVNQKIFTFDIKLLQNLEPSSVSRQYATRLLDAALDQCKWELSKDLVRFLRAIGKCVILHEKMCTRHSM
jgi:hypothetical protein